MIARQFIVQSYHADPSTVCLMTPNENTGYGYRSETYSNFDFRLRKHLSLAEENCWQRCADKLIAALPEIPIVRRPFIALLLPEKPDIANELASLESPSTSFYSKEWLKVVATDNTAVKNSNDTGAWTYLAIVKPVICRMKTTSVTLPARPFYANRELQPFPAWRCMLIKKTVAACWYK